MVLIFGSKLVPDFGTKIPLLVLNFGSKLVPDFGTKISLLVLIFGSKLVPDFGTDLVPDSGTKKLTGRTEISWPTEQEKLGQ